MAAGDDGMVLLGRGAHPLPGGATIVGTTASGEAVFLLGADRVDRSVLAAGCPGTINFDNTAGDLLWTEATNWDTDALPAPSDDACIDGFEVTLWSGTQQVGSLFVTTASSLLQRAGTLIVDTDSEIQGPFTLDGDLGSARVEGAGQLVLSGPVTWRRGGFGVPGGVLATGPVTVDGPFASSVFDGTFRNTSTVNWTQGWVGVGGPAELYNDGTWEVTGDGTMDHQNSTTSRFVNNGLFRKTVATGVTEIRPWFDNPGTVDVQSGTLQLEGGGLWSGTLQGAGDVVFAGGTFDFTQTSVLVVPLITVNSAFVNIDGSYDVPGPLTVTFGGVTFEWNADYVNLGPLITRGQIRFESNFRPTLPALTMTGGSIGGLGVTVAGPFEWSAGTLSGPVTVEGATDMTGAIRHTVWGDLFLNTGTVTMSGEGIFELVSGGQCTNAGSWELTSDAGIFTPSPGSLTFTNDGTMRKTVATGSTRISPLFVNNGSLEARSGVLTFIGGFIQYDGRTLLDGGDIEGDRPFEFRGGRLQGTGTATGTVSIVGATVEPGLSAGILTVVGTYSHSTDATLLVELGGRVAGSEHDRLDVEGEAILGGTLDVVLTDGFVPSLGDSFVVLQASSVQGTFAVVNTPTLPGGEGWTVTYTDTAVTLTVGGSCPDDDGDGYTACEECDDTDPTINPGATEIACDGIDQDCDGLADDSPDGDLDGFGVCEDCDDADPAVYPGATEVPDDGIDQDCDGTDAITCYTDSDQDGYGGDETVVAPDGSCDVGQSEAAETGDCDDGDAAVRPDAAEICDDGIDNDCDGDVDLDDVPECSAAVTICSTLADGAPGHEADQDAWTFEGTVDEVVTIDLVSDDGTGGSVDLILMDAIETEDVFEVDRSPLPNRLLAVLPASGTYVVAVSEQPTGELVPRPHFGGAFCLTVEGSLGAGGTLAATSTVESQTVGSPGTERPEAGPRRPGPLDRRRQAAPRPLPWQRSLRHRTAPERE
jgi:hypothetical protein